MASDAWAMDTLGGIADGVYGMIDGPFGSNLPASDYTDKGIPVVRGSNLSLGENRFKSQEFVFVSDATANRLNRSVCRPGDIIFTKKGTIGQTGIIPNDSGYDRFLLSSNQMKLTVDPEKAIPLFVYYFVSSTASREKILQDASVTGVPKINLAYIRTFPILLPSLEEQKEIVGILCALDERIELLQNENLSLEQVARAIFKSWFVDFDPVRAKAEGREPGGMDAATAALFPSKFSSSAQGQIPIGWHFRRAGDLMKQSRESINPLRHSDELFTHYSLPAFDEGRRPRLEYGREIKSNKTVIPVECILLSKLNPHIPRVWLPGRKIQENAVCSTEFLVFQPAIGLSVEYLYCQFVEPGFAQRFGGLTTGTSNSHQRVKPDYLLEEELIEPTRAVVEAFTSVTHPLFEKINENIDVQKTFAELRDTLLPRLISGKLRVPEAEKLVEAVL